MWILYTAIALLFYSVGEYYSKLYANGRFCAMFLGLACYMICTAFWFPALKNNNHLVVMSLIWSLGYSIVAVLVGVLIFKEHLVVQHCVGIILAAIAIILLNHA